MTRHGRLSLLAALLGLLALAPLALAQDAPRLVVISPANGEILYASRLGYIVAIPVTGEVHVPDGAPGDTAVTLTVRAPHAAPIELRTQADERGFFRFNLDLNPDNIPLPSVGERYFDYAVHCPDCHFSSPAALPVGRVTLEITAVHPQAGQVTAVRHITVDRSGRATLPVQVVLVDGDGLGLAGIPVQAETRLYEWRGRIARDVTDADGRADLDVEALSQRATHYLVSVPPTLIDNRRYQSESTQEVIIPADGRQAPPVTLRVTVENGIIDGRLAAPGGPGARTTVLAVAEPGGQVYETVPGVDGAFHFDGLPLGRYLVVAQAAGEAGRAWASRPAQVDLRDEATAVVALAPAADEGMRQDGRVLDEHGRPLPFGWFAGTGGGYLGQVSPLSGAFVLAAAGDEAQAPRLTAPGYWGQSITPDGAGPLEIRMQPRPDLRTQKWGDGRVYLPGESVINETDGVLSLVRGWIWGHNGTAAPFVLNLEGAELALSAGDFALEYAPGEASYLYVNNGEATFTSREGVTQPIKGGQMMAFGDGVPRPEPAPAEEQVVSLLRAGRRPTVDLPYAAAPSLIQRARQAAARLGQSATQIMVGATYVLMLVAPLLVLLWGLRRLVKVRG